MQTSTCLDHICGIDPSFIDNRDTYQSIITDMTCPMCLNVVCEPLECRKCQCLICEKCYFILQVAEQKCVTPNCEGDFQKANKFVREILSALKITCPACLKKGMRYTDYLKHIQECDKYLSNPLMKMVNDINSKDNEIKQLEEELKKAENAAENNGNLNISQDELKKMLLTSSLPVNHKMELYNACIEGRLDDFKKLIIEKGFPILEEVSAKNYGWTPLHYAMHYGKIEIIKFIMDYLHQKGLLKYAMMLKSSDGRTPLLCLIRSNNLAPSQKKIMVQQINSICPIPLNIQLKEENGKLLISSSLYGTNTK